MSPPTDGPDFSLADVAREGLIERPGVEPATHDGTGRVDLAFTVMTTAEDGAEVPPALRDVRVPPGVTVFDAASWNGIAIDSTCGGHGTCHKCRIRVTSDSRDPDHPPRRAHLHRGAARRGLAPRLPAPRDPRPRCRGPSADHPAQGRDRRDRASGDPAPGPPEALRRARRGHARRPAHRPRTPHRRHRRPRAHRRPPRAAPAVHGAARGRLQGHRGHPRRGPRRRRARRHHGCALRHRVRPRHHDGGRHAPRRRHRHPARRRLGPQRPAAVRRRRHHPDQRHDDGPRGPRAPPAARRQHAVLAGRPRCAARPGWTPPTSTRWPSPATRR